MALARRPSLTYASSARVQHSLLIQVRRSADKTMATAPARPLRSYSLPAKENSPHPDKFLGKCDDTFRMRRGLANDQATIQRESADHAMSLAGTSESEECERQKTRRA